jgi:hypothetical protein
MSSQTPASASAASSCADPSAEALSTMTSRTCGVRIVRSSAYTACAVTAMVLELTITTPTRSAAPNCPPLGHSCKRMTSILQ